MKTILTLMLLSAITVAVAQDKTGNKPAEGFWMIESTVKKPKDQTIKFFSADRKLIYQERVTGKKVDLRKVKVRKQLDQVLARLNAGDSALLKTNLVARAGRH